MSSFTNCIYFSSVVCDLTPKVPFRYFKLPHQVISIFVPITLFSIRNFILYKTQLNDDTRTRSDGRDGVPVTTRPAEL